MSNWFIDKLGPDPRANNGAGSRTILQQPKAQNPQAAPQQQRAQSAPAPQARAPEPPRQQAAAPPPKAAAPAPKPEEPKKKKGWF